jgi:hypothetical protein
MNYFPFKEPLLIFVSLVNEAFSLYEYSVSHSAKFLEGFGAMFRDCLVSIAESVAGCTCEYSVCQGPAPIYPDAKFFADACWDSMIEDHC